MAARTHTRVATDIFTVVSFCGLLALPALDRTFGLDRTTALNEKRQLATRPKMPYSLGAVAEFPKAFDDYVSDHFGFRPLLVRLHARATVRWLGVSSSPNVDVMVGRHGWLFFTGDRSIPYVEGREPFSESALEKWRRALRQRNEWLGRRGIRYLVVFAPGSASIYPEHLPRWVRPSSHGTRLDQLMGAMKSCPEVAILDLRPVLLRGKLQGPVYSRTDTHWNMLGAWAACDGIVGRLTPWFAEVQAAPLSSYTLDWTRSQGGDLAVMAGIQGMVSEERPTLAPKEGWRQRTVKSDAYARAGGPPRGPVPEITECDRGRVPRVVFFGDSFGMALKPFLSEYFGRAAYLWLQDLDPSVVEREKPDLVIQEYAERLLSVIDPATWQDLDASPARRAVQ